MNNSSSNGAVSPGPSSLTEPGLHKVSPVCSARGHSLLSPSLSDPGQKCAPAGSDPLQESHF